VTITDASTTQGIKTILMPVSDLAAAKAVYNALLEMSPQADSECHVGFDGAGQRVGLLPGGRPQGLTSPVAYWLVADIEAKLAELTAAGPTVKAHASDVGDGRLVATVTDPGGHVLGVVQVTPLPSPPAPLLLRQLDHPALDQWSVRRPTPNRLTKGLTDDLH
jgi:predicted enzyme related to lactoylglutathione lyase